MKTPFLTALALAGLLVQPLAQAITTILPTHPNLQYTGRIDDRDPKAPVLSFPGTRIAGNFTGTSLAIVLDDERGENFFDVRIDGEEGRPILLQASKGSKSYVVANGLAPGRHSFVITRRTEGAEGPTVFKGLELDNKAELLAPPARPGRRIEFFGDSITSGMGNEAPDPDGDDRPKDKNQLMSYASITARALQAEAHITSQSGIGVLISWFPFTMPDFYDQSNAVGDNDSKWDFSRWTPDVVVINLMQNDSWLIGRDHKLQPEPNDAQRIAAYQAFVAKIRSVYPKAYIVCALGSMDATRPGSPWPGYVRSAVDNLARAGDKRIDTVFFPYTGFDKHPRVKQHQANAEILTGFIRKKMGW